MVSTHTESELSKSKNQSLLNGHNGCTADDSLHALLVWDFKGVTEFRIHQFYGLHETLAVRENTKYEWASTMKAVIKGLLIILSIAVILIVWIWVGITIDIHNEKVANQARIEKQRKDKERYDDFYRRYPVTRATPNDPYSQSMIDRYKAYQMIKEADKAWGIDDGIYTYGK